MVTTTIAAHHVRLEGALAVQAGRPMLVTFAAAHTVDRQKKVDEYDPVTGNGYQRLPSGPRIPQVRKYYEQGGHMPNPLLVNIRKDEYERLEVVVTDGDQGSYEEAIKNGGDWIGAGYIEIPEDLVLWVYDGQHRALGFSELIASVPRFGTYPVPLSITLGLSQDEEMLEFYEVNSNAKAVSTGLAWEILRKRAAYDADFALDQEFQGKDWKTKGADVVDELRKLEGPWKDTIQAPNVQKRRNDRLTLVQAQFVRSLRPVLDMALLRKADPSVIAQILNAYWQGIAKVLPEPFDPNENPKQWVIQKGPGAIALHRVLPDAIEVVRARGSKLGDPDGYADVMKGIADLTGEIFTDNGPEGVSGADYWLAGPSGVASQYTGDAGRKRLAMLIRSVMPRAAEELAL
jgi:DGQHR domain-containing protein